MYSGLENFFLQDIRDTIHGCKKESLPYSLSARVVFVIVLVPCPKVSLPRPTLPPSRFKLLHPVPIEGSPKPTTLFHTLVIGIPRFPSKISTLFRQASSTTDRRHRPTFRSRPCVPSRKLERVYTGRRGLP